MQLQLQKRAESDDEVMVALNKKVAEWKVGIQDQSFSFIAKDIELRSQKLFITGVSIKVSS